MPSPTSETPPKIEIVPFVARPVGWMRCVACADYKKQPGKMWLGYNFRTHEDYVIDCPVCKGKGQVERYKYYDVRNGEEIDYENPHVKFVHTLTLDH